MTDTPEVYVKQCDCNEIQEHRRPSITKLKDGRYHWQYDFHPGDVFVAYDSFEKKKQQIEIVGTTIYSPNYYGKSPKPKFDIEQVGFDEGGGYLSERVIWLPSQAQIQGMMGFGIGALVNDFYEFCADELKMFDDPDNFPDSMEQLWLMFYMYEKHSKVWTGTEWEEKS